MHTLRSLVITLPLIACTASGAPLSDPASTAVGASTATTAGSSSTSVNRSGPLAFGIGDVDGGQTTLEEVIDGRVAVIDFWATWCKPCKKSLPKVDALARENHPGLVVIGMNVGDNLKNAIAFKGELGLSLPIYLDPGAELAPLMEVFSLPTLLILDTDGQVVHRGKSLDDAAKARLRKLLRKH